MQLTPEDLLIGASITFDVAIPHNVLHPGGNQSLTDEHQQNMIVQLRPLTIGTFQLIMKAARNEPALIPLLMIKESLVQPVMSLEQVKQLHLGLVNFLIQNIREISGLTGKKTPLTD
jgi:hypothetical protein